MALVKHIFFFLFCMAISTAIYAQEKYGAKITVIDAVSQKPLTYATVSILNAADSVLLSYGWTATDGSLTLSSIPKINCIVMIRFPTYVDYVRHVIVNTSQTTVDLGVVKLTPTLNVLREVVINGAKTGLIINGDTLQYNASSFVIEKNAKVEDLLRQIPGMQVDNFGKITIYGKTVEKVLVDGEEFFGDDPTLVTRNIRGDMVKTIQIFDKKSDQATFSGIDDGIKTKTINVKLKEDKKKGYFGQATASYGTQQYNQQQFLFNLFRAKTKFSAFGTLANTGKIALSESENNKYGINAENNNLFLRGILVSVKNNDEDLGAEKYDGQGNPTARTGGIHFDSKWDQDKQSINTNLLIGALEIAGIKNTLSRNELPNTIQSTGSDQSYEKYARRSKADATYFAKLDSSATLTISIDGAHKTNESSNTFNTITLAEDLSKLNAGQRFLSSNGEQNTITARQFFTRKFKTPRRTISLELIEATNNSNTNGFLNAQNTFYLPNGNISTVENINQYKTWRLKNQIVGGTFTYTEPISTYLSLSSAYGVGWANTASTRNSYNHSIGGEFDQIDPQYSDDYKMNERSQRIQASLSYKKGRQSFNVSNEINDIRFNQLDLHQNRTFKRRFTNYLPFVWYNKSTEKQSFLFTYNGSPIQPTINQIQPIRTNLDPLNIFIGNADLLPAYKQSFYLSYSRSKRIPMRIISLSARLDIIDNPLINSFTTSAAGATVYQTLNYTDGNSSNFTTTAAYITTIPSLNMNVNYGLSFSNIIDYYLSNSLLNKRNTQVYSARLYFFKYLLKKYNVILNLRPSYLASKAKYDQQFNNSGFALTVDGSATAYFLKTWAITAKVDYNYQAKTDAFREDLHRFLLNTSLSKKFFEKQNVKLSLSVNDLLNQNKGFTRTANGTILTQTNFSTIKRYGLLSLTWDFSKFGTLKPE